MGCVHSILKANKSSNGINGHGQVNATCIQTDMNNESDLNVTKVTLGDLEMALEDDKGFPTLYDNNMMESSGSESFDKLGSSSTIADFTKDNERRNSDIQSKFPVDEKNKKTKAKKNKNKESDEKGHKGKNAKFRNNLRASIKKGLNVMALANLLAMNALDLTAPASDALIKTRKNAWVQLAGHPGSFAPAGPSTIWKKRLTVDNTEVKAYQALMDDPVKPVVPKFHREVEYSNEFFIEMEDLLQHFTDPNIMDIKMGVRTFMESEVKNPVLRKDLYEKMIKVDPTAPTTAEHEQRAVTKLRYMQFREHESSTAELGFRIEAIRMSGEPPKTDLKKTRTQDQVACQIYTFLNGFETVRAAVADRLVEIRDKFASSSFFKLHEIIGSSLLLMYDSVGNSGGWMIDFAKTLPLEDGITKTHTKYWTAGSHEDGYLLGMENLIAVFQKLGDPDYENFIQSVLRAEVEELSNQTDVTIEKKKSGVVSADDVVLHENSFDGTVKFHPLSKAPEFGAIREDSINTSDPGSVKSDADPENVLFSNVGESSSGSDVIVNISSKADSDNGNTDSAKDVRISSGYSCEIVNSISNPGYEDDMLGNVISDAIEPSIEPRSVEVSRTEAHSDRTNRVNTYEEVINSESYPEHELIDNAFVDNNNDSESLASSGTIEEGNTGTVDNRLETKYSKMQKTRLQKTDSLVSELVSGHNSDASRESQTSPT